MNKQFLALKEAQQNAVQRYTYAIGPFTAKGKLVFSILAISI